MICIEEDGREGLSGKQIEETVLRSLRTLRLQGSREGAPLSKVLILPPDITRLHSGAGDIANVLYHHLRDNGCQVDVMPALGSHAPMTEEECDRMYGDIPFSAFLVHDWRKDTVKLGEIPSGYVEQVTEGLWREPLAVEVNWRLLDPSYDLIISVGQVVPHEMAGMANYSKNIFVGCGGSDMISKTHMIGANYGIGRIMGRDHTPLREIWDYALRTFFTQRPVLFIMTVATAPQDRTHIHGLYIGRERDTLEKAIEKSKQVNMIHVERPIRTCVAYLEPGEFKTVWLGNKALYRTRGALAEGGRLIILGAAVSRFGEDLENDRLIRKYGYFGRERIMELYQQNQDLQDNLAVTSHLLMGSTDGQFEVVYATGKMDRATVERSNYSYGDYDALAQIYRPDKAKPGWNRTGDGEEFYFIPNPALGLWVCGERSSKNHSSEERKKP